jgi:twitching motility protein PilT
MSKASHQVFTRIMVHNRLMSEADVGALLAEMDDPEQAMASLVERQVLKQKTATQVLALYRKKLDELLAEELDFGDEPGAVSEQAPLEREPALPEGWQEQPPAASGGEPPGNSLGDTAPEQLKPLPGAGAELVHQLLRVGREMGASDLHLKAEMAPVVRLHGELRPLPYPPLPQDACREALLAILDDQQRAEFLERWDLDFCYDAGGLGRFRTNYLHEHRGVDGVFRMIPNQVPSFEELGLPDQVKRFAEYRVGVVLVTGPKGCGKTTTLAAMVDMINTSRAEHIITVEDPIEFVQPCRVGHVNQRQVGVHTQSFSNALRSALREAPDVIMVGEMRDLETTSLAITAAETGHLVLATLHTPDAIRTIGRVLDVFPPKEQPQIRAMLSESLRGIVSQLLLPATDGQSMVLAVEILVNTPAIGHLIREEKVHQIRGLMQTGKQYGMILMDESLIQLAREGRIQKETAVSRADNVKMVRAALDM